MVSSEQGWPRGMREWRTPGKRRIEGRYWNVNGHPIAIIASITLHPNEEPFDWAAYIGGDDADEDEETTCEKAARYGAKLSESDARHFFPELAAVSYRY